MGSEMCIRDSSAVCLDLVITAKGPIDAILSKGLLAMWHLRNLESIVRDYRSLDLVQYVTMGVA